MTASSSLRFGSAIIEYSVSFARRKTVVVEVHPDQQVTILVPEGSTAEEIESLVRKRARWILQQQQQFSDHVSRETPRAYVSGESYRYLGKQYRLKVLDGPESVKQERAFIYVTVPNKNDKKQVQKVLEEWYRRRAYQIFSERLELCYPRLERLGVQYPPLALRAMKTRWGSCSQEGSILLNPRLVQVPIDCIDYVIIHELCHLKEHNHSRQYYQLLDQTLPDWRERRRKLNTFEF